MAFKPRKDTCGFLGCDEARMPDSYMCGPHDEVLRPIREDFKRMEDPYGTRTKGSSTPRPRCTRPGCKNPRKAGEPMCADCAEAQFWETGED